MPLTIAVDDLLAYTDWQRRSWRAWFPKEGARAWALPVGPHGDGRFETVGDMVKHIFSAEKRYIDRLTNRTLTDPKAIPSDVDPLFQFGDQSRKDLRDFLATFPKDKWDVSEEHTILNHKLQLTPRKIIVHVVMHEIRHWAQIATVLRQAGMKGDFHDFLAAPVMGGR